MCCSHALTHKNVGRDVGRYIMYDGMVGWYTAYYTGDYGYKSYGLDYGFKNTRPN